MVEMVWFPNASGLGVKDNTGDVPVPCSETVPETVPRIVSTAERKPVGEGVNVTFTVQEPETAMVAPATQFPVPVFAKLLASVPVIVKYGVAKTSAAVPVLVTVMVSGALVVPTFWLGKLTGLGLKLKTGAELPLVVNGCG